MNLSKSDSSIQQDKARSVPTAGPAARWPLLETFQNNARGLYRFFLVRVNRDEATADDLMQELSLQVARSSPGESAGEIEDCLAWLFTAAKRVLWHHWRSAQRRRSHLPPEEGDAGAALAELIDAAPLAQELLHRQDVQQQLMLALTRLPQEQQNLLIDFYFERKSQSALAQEHKLSERAIEGRLYRARQALREKLCRDAAEPTEYF